MQDVCCFKHRVAHLAPAEVVQLAAVRPAGVPRLRGRVEVLFNPCTHSNSQYPAGPCAL